MDDDGGVRWIRTQTHRRTVESETADRLIERFLYPPLLAANFAHGWETRYTAIYRPTEREAQYRRPGAKLVQSFKDFREVRVTLDYDTTTGPRVEEARSELPDLAEQQ